MRVFIASLQSAPHAPYSPSRAYEREHPRREKETFEDYEKRTWRERCHYTGDRRLFIPPTAFKESLCTAARYLGTQIPGKGKATYTKHFVAGILVQDGIMLPLTIDEVEGEWLYLNADGRKGGSKRVWKCEPKILEWGGDVAFHAVDDAITLDIFQHHLEQAGAFIGIGRFRPEKGGWYGRYLVKEVTETTL